MRNILKKLALATAAAGMMMLGPISISDNTAKADRDGWGRSSWNRGGWNRGYRGYRSGYRGGWVRRGIPGDGWRYRGGYYRPYYGGYGYYQPYAPVVPWTRVYNVPGYYW